MNILVTFVLLMCGQLKCCTILYNLVFCDLFKYDILEKNASSYYYRILYDLRPVCTFRTIKVGILDNFWVPRSSAQIMVQIKNFKVLNFIDGFITMSNNRVTFRSFSLPILFFSVLAPDHFCSL